MDKMLSLCGYRCDLCAARSDDPALRQKLVDGWKKYLGHEMYTVENVRCDGCKSHGKLADKTCPVRPCAMEKGIDSCAHCGEFPCDKLKGLICSREKFVARLGEIPEEDYNLCLRQFESEPELKKLRKIMGKK
jgi:hypothetical protein